MRIGRPDVSTERIRGALIVVLLAGTALCWMLLTPPGAAADEPSHLTRAGSLADGQLDGEFVGNGIDIYELPDRYRIPEPGCYAFQPTVSVDCAEPPVSVGDTTLLATRANEYPIWGHLTYGIPTLLPGLAPIWWARLTGIAVAVAFVAASLRLRPGVWGAAGVVTALTPMWWATAATVNPSTFGIAGAVGLWVALLSAPPDRSRSVAWLAAFGWLALALPRRDGLIWASLIVVIALAATDRSVLQWLRSLGRGPLAVIAAATVATVVWGLTQRIRTSQMVVLSPLLLVAYELAYRAWTTHAKTTNRRVAMVSLLGLLGAGGVAVLVSRRPGGWDTALARTVVGQTRANLVEAVGRLGWLDAPLPRVAPLLVVLALAALTGAVLTQRLKPVVVASLTLATIVVTSWVFELFQGNTSGQYWQGRYSLPLLAGVPIVLTASTVPTKLARHAGTFAIATMLFVLNVAAWAAARRWSVGVDGSILPWDWSTIHSPVEPLAVLAAHALLTGGLALTLTPPPQPRHDAVVAEPVSDV